ncbi:MAG: phosphotransferase family protein [Solirubrobacterales bacterium]
MDLRPLRRYLDDLGLAPGGLALEPIGEGHSNITYLVTCGDERLVLRRPPLGRLSRSANDVIREARVLTTLGPTPIAVPRILAVCEEQDVIGAPFFLAEFVPGHVLTAALPAGWGRAEARDIGFGLVEALVDLHALDLAATGLGAFGRPRGYLERQLGRFGGLLEENATRPLPLLERVADWLAANLPESPPAAFVHGDFRLGNVILDRAGKLAAVLDWEMATSGDPLADLGYLTAMWAEPDDEEDPMLELSRVTRSDDFPSRAELVDRYAELSGLNVEALPWYQALALWKSAIFLEGSYNRFLAGDSADPYFAGLGPGVERLAERAWTLCAAA